MSGRTSARIEKAWKPASAPAMPRNTELSAPGSYTHIAGFFRMLFLRPAGWGCRIVGRFSMRSLRNLT